MGTKSNPGQFDCYANAAADEPMFVLLARDENAPGTVEAWVRKRQMRKGLTMASLDDKAREAMACAEAMREWQRREERPPEQWFKCGVCGHLVDTPNHVHGCTAGRQE